MKHGWQMSDNMTSIGPMSKYEEIWLEDEWQNDVRPFKNAAC